MNKLNNVLAEMDFEFLGSNKHAISIDALKNVLNDGHYLLLDVRTEQELSYLHLPFATHIPMHELPERIDELPRDKCIVPFCSSVFRAGVVYAFLLANGFDEVKCLTASTENIASALKPGPLAKILA